MLKSFIGKVTARVRCEINSVYSGDWLGTAVLRTWALIYARHESWRSVSQHFSCLESSRKQCNQILSSQTLWIWLKCFTSRLVWVGFPLDARKKMDLSWTKLYLFEGRIAAYHLKPDYDVNSKGAAALIKICLHLHFLVPLWKVWSMSSISVLDAGRNRTSLDAVST